MSLCIHLEDTLKKAEGIFLQMKLYKKLPVAVKEILGLVPSSSPIQSYSSSSQLVMDIPLVQDATHLTSVSTSTKPTTPDDSSIEILADTADTAIDNFYH